MASLVSCLHENTTCLSLVCRISNQVLPALSPPPLTDAECSVQLVLAFAAALATFFLVPRGVSAGEISIQSDHMSWNISEGTYQLNLKANISVFNPNYLHVSDSLYFRHAQSRVKPDQSAIARLLVTLHDQPRKV